MAVLFFAIISILTFNEYNFLIYCRLIVIKIGRAMDYHEDNKQQSYVLPPKDQCLPPFMCLIIAGVYFIVLQL